MRLRPLLLAVLALALLAAAPAHAGEPVRTYMSRPDLKPVVVHVLHAEAGLAPGAIFLAPKRGPGQGGPLIMGEDGQPIWFLRCPTGGAPRTSARRRTPGSRC